MKEELNTVLKKMKSRKARKFGRQENLTIMHKQKLNREMDDQERRPQNH